MIATVTDLIALAVEHGLGVAFLVIGAQVVLDRLMPVEQLAAFLFGARKSTPVRGAHRRTRTPRPSVSEQVCARLVPDRNKPMQCME